MPAELETAWRELVPEQGTQQIWSLLLHLFLAGALAIFVRFLFRRFSVSASGTDSISRVFPMLTIITTAVILVVKSSLALSLGLVGALSIVRFRAAIKEPEELVYLFLCIAIGLALGAEQLVLALATVGVATVYVASMHYVGKAKSTEKLLLTISGDTTRCFQDEGGSVLETVKQVAGGYTLQRCDVENGRSQLRLLLPGSSAAKTDVLIKRLRAELPEFEMSYVNLNSTL